MKYLCYHILFVVLIVINGFVFKKKKGNKERICIRNISEGTQLLIIDLSHVETKTVTNSTTNIVGLFSMTTV